MLKKVNRADRKTVEKVFQEGKFLNSLSLTFKFFKTTQKNSRISVLVPKNIARLAVKRNKLRRLGYKVLEKYLKDFPAGTMGVLLFKKYQDDILVLENEIKNIFNKIN